MNLALQKRAAHLREAMDDPACDLDRLRRTYAQFETLNRWLAGWRRIFDRRLRPVLGSGGSVLDVGCGGGDVARSLERWSAEVGVALDITGIDRDERALAFARAKTTGATVRYRRATPEELLAEGRRYDVVISNHVVHHLTEAEVVPFLDTTAALARKLVLHNDLRRSDLAYLAFAPLGLLVRGSFIVPDGLISIRRAFRPAELRRRLPEAWRVERHEPFRMLITRRPGGAP